jgi:hypothetical protein
MDDPELGRLLTKKGYSFNWNEADHTWSLFPILNSSGNQAMRMDQSALNFEEGQAAAVQVLTAFQDPKARPASDSQELDSLLNLYRLSFHWGNPGMKWWLIGQNKGSNALSRSVPRPAKDIETAKADAVRYILSMHPPAVHQEGEV